MAFLFAKPLSPAEQLKKHKREIDRAIRDLERERTKLQMQEKKIIAEIRKAAAQNQQVSRAGPSSTSEPLAAVVHPKPTSSNPPTPCQQHPSPSRYLTGCVRLDLGPQAAAKIMAKDLVRTRRHITKFYQMKTHLQGVSLKLQTLKSNQAMADAMKGATRVRFPCHCSPLLPLLCIL
jgi:charged multivesicular body protein 2A